MNPSNVLWSIINMYGMGKNQLRNNRMIYCSVFSVYMLVQSILSCLMRWNTLKYRYLALEDVACTVYSTAMIFEHGFLPNSIFKLIRIVDSNKFDRYNMIISETKEKEMINHEETVSTRKQVKKFIFVLSFFILNFAIPCFVISWYKIISNYVTYKDRLLLTDLILPYECWFPIEPNDITILYLVLTICNATYLTIVIHHMLLSMGSTIVSIRRVSSDIKLLEQSISEIDSIYKSVDCTEKILNLYLGCIVDHHNRIIRNIKNISDALSFGSLNVHSCAFVLSGLSMYWFIEGSDSMDRMRYVVSVIMVAAIVYFYSVNGQMIQTEGENLRNVLYGYSWIDKPQWFKKSFLIIMTKATKSLQVKPLGLYVLDFSSFTSMLNGAYAFTNILRTFKKRQ